MKKYKYSIVLSILVICITSLLFPACTTKAPQASTPTEKDFEVLRTMLRQSVDSGKAPGVYFGIAHHGKTVFEESYGIADIEQGRPFTKDTIVPLSSITKPIAVSVIMTLVDEGKLSLDDPVSKYLPEFDNLKVKGTGEKAPSPTIRQCLGMTSGIFGNAEATPTGSQAIRNINVALPESVEIIAKQELTSLPGTRYSYSGASFQVVGRIAELVTGLTFDQVLREKLTKPLGMESTFYTSTGNRIQEEAERLETIYIPNSEGGFDLVARLADMGAMKLLLVAGGIASTPGDYFKFLTMHLNGGTYDSVRILSSESVAEMQKIHTTGLEGTEDIDILGYCLGWYAFRTDDKGNVRELGHGGLYGTYCWIDLDRDLAMFFATNQPIRLVPDIYEPLHDKVMDIFPGPESIQTKTHEVKPAIIEEFSIAPSQISPGQSATLTWIVTGTGITATIEPDIGDISATRTTTDRMASNIRVSPSKTTTYTITATTPAGGEVTKSVTLTVK